MNKASIITIGDEILIGQIIDTNAAWLGDYLSVMGIDIVLSISVPDKKESIIHALKTANPLSDLIVLTGGLGPTKDDITKHAIADFLESSFYFDKDMYEGMMQFFKKFNVKDTAAHRQQCYLPEGAVLLDNKMGTAPGMLYDKGGVKILCLPGVPYEMKWIIENSFKSKWAEFNGSPFFIEHVLIKTIGIGETHVEERITPIVNQLPKEITVAYLPSLGEVKVRLTSKAVVSGFDKLQFYQSEMINVLGTVVYGTGKTTIEKAVMDIFIKNGKTLATAESCTGGYIAHRLTTVPGSSKYYTGSIIAYSYEIKEKTLKVNKNTLEEYGAVSEQTVSEMLNGLLKKMNTDIGLAVSGIAGPGGGTPTKPVGTVWLAWGSKEKQFTEKLQLGKDRMKNIEYTAVASMNRLRLFLTD